MGERTPRRCCIEYRTCDSVCGNTRRADDTFKVWLREMKTFGAGGATDRVEWKKRSFAALSRLGLGSREMFCPYYYVMLCGVCTADGMVAGAALFRACFDVCSARCVCLLASRTPRPPFMGLPGSDKATCYIIVIVRLRGWLEACIKFRGKHVHGSATCGRLEWYIHNTQYLLCDVVLHS